MLHYLTEYDLPKWVKNRKMLMWIGALSFEDRCIGSIEYLSKINVQITKGILFNYSTEVYPRDDAERKRNKNLNIMKQHEGSVFKNELEIINLSAYEYDAIQKVLIVQ